MKKGLVLLCLVIYLEGLGQIPGTKIDGPIKLFDSLNVREGDIIYFGHGSNPNTGDFVHIYTPANGWAGTAEIGMNKMFAGKQVEIKHFKQFTTKKTGTVILGVINTGGYNLAVNFEPAIRVGEIIKINGADFTKKDKPQAVIINQKPSLADELAKLKKLLDDGAITKDEYEALKKKVIEGND